MSNVGVIGGGFFVYIFTMATCINQWTTTKFVTHEDNINNASSNESNFHRFPALCLVFDTSGEIYVEIEHCEQ